MTTTQLVAALDEEIERLKHVRAILARDFTINRPRKATSKPQESPRSRGQRLRWAKARAARAVPAPQPPHPRAAPAPQVKITRLRPHREPHRYGSRPRKREKTALMAEIPTNPVAVKRPGGAPFTHRPFEELEKLLKAS